MRSSWDINLNLNAYQEVESLSNYTNIEELMHYRDLLIERSMPVALCINKTIHKGNKLRVLELCSGSSRLLFTLDKLQLLEMGYGVEVSQSRYQFAEQWKEYLKTPRIHNINCSVNDYSFDCGNVDLVIMIDGALSYLYPSDPELPKSLLQKISGVLKPGGKIILEFDVLSQEKINAMRNDGYCRVWKRGDSKDTFKYALYEMEPVDWEHMIVHNCSIYLHRTTMTEKVKKELYKYYTIIELDLLLPSFGYQVQHYGSFQLDSLGPDSCSIVTLAEKQ